MVEARHQNVLAHEFDGNDCPALIGHKSAGRDEAPRSNHTLCGVKVAGLERVFSFSPESVNEGRLDKISGQFSCWSFRCWLTSLALEVQSS